MKLLVLLFLLNQDMLHQGQEGRDRITLSEACKKNSPIHKGADNLDAVETHPKHIKNFHNVACQWRWGDYSAVENVKKGGWSLIRISADSDHIEIITKPK